MGTILAARVSTSAPQIQPKLHFKYSKCILYLAYCAIGAFGYSCIWNTELYLLLGLIYHDYLRQEGFIFAESLQASANAQIPWKSIQKVFFLCFLDMIWSKSHLDPSKYFRALIWKEGTRHLIVCRPLGRHFWGVCTLWKQTMEQHSAKDEWW